MIDYEIDYLLNCKIKIIEDYSIKKDKEIKHVLYLSDGEYKSCMLKKFYNRDLRSTYERLKQVHTPYLPVVYECLYLEDEKVTYVVESKAEGKNLENYLKEKGKLSETEAGQIIISICNALQYLHGLKPPIIHRDIKPSNVVISDDCSIKLIDFDVARNYDHQKENDTICFGTKNYAAPEQYGFGQTTIATDIFATGVTLHEMLTGEVNCKEVNYNGEMGKVIKKCIEFDPKKRYESAEALAEDINKIIGKDYVKKTNKNLGISVLIIFILVVVVSGYCYATSLSKEDTHIVDNKNLASISDKNYIISANEIEQKEIAKSGYDKKIEDEYSSEITSNSEIITQLADENVEITANITDENNEITTNITDENNEITTNITDENNEIIPNITNEIVKDENDEITTKITDEILEDTNNITYTTIRKSVDCDEFCHMISDNAGTVYYITKKDDKTYINTLDGIQKELDFVGEAEGVSMIYDKYNDKLYLDVFDNRYTYCIYQLNESFEEVLLFEGISDELGNNSNSSVFSDGKILLGNHNNTLYDFEIYTKIHEIGNLAIDTDYYYNNIFLINDELYVYCYDDYIEMGKSYFQKYDIKLNANDVYDIPVEGKEIGNKAYYKISAYNDKLYFFNKEGLMQFDGDSYELIISYNNTKYLYPTDYQYISIANDEVYFYDKDNKSICIITENDE